MKKDRQYQRRKRRRANAKLREPNAVRPHKEIAGRTWAIFSKRTPAKSALHFAALAEVAALSVLGSTLGERK